jgi:hypothetical protein
MLLFSVDSEVIAVVCTTVYRPAGMGVASRDRPMSRGFLMLVLWVDAYIMPARRDRMPCASVIQYYSLYVN